jgi:hypothetical protein
VGRLIRRVAPGLGALLLATWPGLASACAYCASSRDSSSAAYLWTAVGLGSLPIGFGGGLALWLRARYKRSVPRAEEEREAARRAA